MGEPAVGIIGGMGPGATVEFMRRVIEATPAEDDRDHVHMIVDNNPKIPSRIEALIAGTGPSPGPAIAVAAQRLERAGADFLVIPCNTAHAYWSAAADAVGIPVWHLAELTMAQIEIDLGAPVRVGMLASPAVRRIALYEACCERHRASLVYPQAEDDLLEVIRAVKAGRAAEREGALLEGAADELVDAGADCLVLGCTEYSLIAHRVRAAVPVYDTLQVLAEAVVSAAKAGVTAGPERDDRSP